MKIKTLLLCFVLAGCGAKTNEDIAKELITAKLKTTLADFGTYNPLNYGEMGSASLPYDETAVSISFMKEISRCRDSAAVLAKMISESKPGAPALKQSLQQWTDSAAALAQQNRTAKQGYTPEKLFTLTHAYTTRDESGQDKKSEYKFFIDKDFTRVVKMIKVY